MENLGDYLQQKREEQGLSIEELVSLTRIPIRFIEAIEANQLELLPNQVTAKGFLRSYAECVDVDPADIAEAFSELEAPSEPFSDDRSRTEILSHVRVEKSHRLPFPRRIILIIVGLVFGLLILVALLSKKDKKVKVLSSALPPQISAPDRPDISEIETVSEEKPLSEEAAPAGAVSPLEEDESVPLEADESEIALSEESPETTTQAVQTETPEDLRVETEAPAGETDPSEHVSETKKIGETAPDVDAEIEEEQSAFVVDVKEYVLSLEAIEASWVQVTIDGEEVREALLQPNDRVEWKATEKFRLTLGNAGGVRVKLDGRDLGSFGPSGEVVHKDISGESGVETN